MAKRKIIGLVFIAILLCAGASLIAWFFLVKPAVDRVFERLPYPPCAVLYEDLNGNQEYDHDQDRVIYDWYRGIDELPDAEMELLDENGRRLRRSVVSKCYLPPEAEHSTIQMVLILPAGYTTTKPVREIEVHYAQDFAWQYFDVKRSSSP